MGNETRWKKVTSLTIGDKVKFNEATVCIEQILPTKVIAAKQQGSVYLFSIEKFNHIFDDLQNRVKMA